MRIAKINRAAAFIVCILTSVLIVVWGNIKVHAEESGSATLICKGKEDILDGMTWRIYYVGFRTDNDLVLEGDFSGYPVTLKDMSAEALTAAASTLESYAVIDNIAPDAQGVTDSDGKIEFTDLKPGLYLVSGNRLKIDNATYIPAPMFIEVSENNPDVTAYPKFTYYDVMDAEVERVRVRKIWENDEDVPGGRPDSIDVEIYCNAVLKETVTLSNENDWTYSWIAETGDTWSVIEAVVPEKYTVTYRSNKTQYVIVNTYDSDVATTTTTTTTTTVVVDGADVTATKTKTTNEIINETTVKSESTSTPKKESKLPQTGQLWWPVPILALGGMVFIGIGCRMISRSKKEDDQ